MILLLQFRSDAAGWHEIKCFYNVLGVSFNQLQIINLFTPGLDWGIVSSFADTAEKIIIGGSGEAGYERPDNMRFLSTLTTLRPLLHDWIESDKHIFGVCLGHQILGDVLGGTVRPSPEHEETGTVLLNTTPVATSDPIFRNLPQSFYVATAHKTSVLSVPSEVSVLATNHNSPIQAMRFKNAWGVQYHPELDEISLNFRLQLYTNYIRNQVDDVESKNFTSARQVIKNFIAL